MLEAMKALFAGECEGVKLGKVKGAFFREEVLTEAELNHHVHIVGASGFGKTVMLSHIVKDRIEVGHGLLFIDLKAEMDTIEKFTRYAKNCGREKELKVFSLSDKSISANYNLISAGTATQVRDKIILSLNWSEEYYKNQASSYLLKVLIGLCYLRDHQNIKFDLGNLLDAVNWPEYIESLALKVPNEQIKVKQSLEDCHRFLRSNEDYKSLQGLRTQLESLTLSDFGNIILNSDQGVDLFEAVKSGKIIFIFLDSRRYGETAKAVGRFIIQDLKMVSSRVDAEIPRSERKQFGVIIDEFADLATEDIIAFLDRARSPKMPLVIAHQEISDLLRISPEFAARLMGNMSTLYAFLQKNPDSAELISGMAGTKSVWKKTMKGQKLLWWDVPTGDTSLREVEEFSIHPNTIKSLGVGECVVVKKYPYSRSHIIKVFPEYSG